MNPSDPWQVEEQFETVVQLVDDRVIDEYDEGGETIQVLAHALSKLPGQRARLVIEFKVVGYYERDWPDWKPSLRDAEWEPRRVYLLPAEQTDYVDRPGIRIRPSLATRFFDTYLPSIKEMDLDLPSFDSGNDDDYRYDESIQKLSNIIEDTSPTKHTFYLDLYMEDGVVYADKGGKIETDENIQKLAHVITRFPQQKALITIEMEVWMSEDGVDSIDMTTAFISPAGTLIHGDLVPSEIEIRVRPSIISHILEKYKAQIEEQVINEPRGWTSIEADGIDEGIQKLADIITEDPDIFTKG